MVEFIKSYSLQLITATISIVVSIITSKLTYKLEIRKDLLNSRKTIYKNTLSIIKRIENDGSIIFDEDFIFDLEQIVTSIHLTGSKKLNQEILLLQDEILLKNHRFNKIYNDDSIEHEARNRVDSIECWSPEDFNKNLSDFRYDIGKEADEYKNINGMNSFEFRKKISNVIDLMRKDLKISD